MTNKDEIRYYRDNRVIVHNGKYFRLSKIKTKKIDSIEHEAYEVWKEFEPDEVMQLREKIVDRLKAKIPIERVVEEILKPMSMDELKKINKILREKGIVKRHDGCLAIFIKGKGRGNSAYIPLFE